MLARLLIVSMLLAFMPAAHAAYPDDTAIVLNCWDVDFEAYDLLSAAEGLLIVRWDDAAAGRPQPTEQEIEDARKPCYGELKAEEIYQQQELRSVTLMEFPMPRTVFSLMEETYTKILTQPSRNAIDPVDTPIWHGLKALRDDALVLQQMLSLALAGQATAEQVRDFDVYCTLGDTPPCPDPYGLGWEGWTVPIPAQE